MSPLQVEAYDPIKDEWVSLPSLNPGSLPGSISQNKPGGTRELYLFECSEDGSHSVIYRSPLGLDIATEDERHVISDRSDWEIVKKLEEGDKPYIMTVRTDISPKGRVVRFRHI